MATGTIDEEIVGYLPLLENQEKVSLLGVIKTFLDLKQAGQLKRTTIQDYNKELDEALSRIESGSFLTQQEAESQINGW
jgi:hypothetical protein